MIHDSYSHEECLLGAFIWFHDFHHPVNHFRSQRLRDVVLKQAILGYSCELKSEKQNMLEKEEIRRNKKWQSVIIKTLLSKNIN